jgi:hypothetical protein
MNEGKIMAQGTGFPLILLFVSCKIKIQEMKKIYLYITFPHRNVHIKKHQEIPANLKTKRVCVTEGGMGSLNHIRANHAYRRELI